MASKKKTAPANPDGLKPLRVGSRVRCTDDGVEGRIVWANALSVKIQWDDGEQVTWRRDTLAERPVEVLDPPDDEPTAPPDQSVPAPAPEQSPEQAAEAIPTEQAPAGEAPASHASTDGDPTQAAAGQPEAAEPARGK